jgi:stage II sporulation protein AA (anti-sigma F factor antagonist)
MSAPPSPDDFRIEQLARADGATVVSVFGEVDLSTAGQLESTLRALAAQKRAAVLDLSQVEFMDSSGISVLVRAARDAQRDGWSFALAAELSKSVERLFTVSGMHEHLPIDGVA